MIKSATKNIGPCSRFLSKKYRYQAVKQKEQSKLRI